MCIVRVCVLWCMCHVRDFFFLFFFFISPPGFTKKTFFVNPALAHGDMKKKNLTKRWAKRSVAVHMLLFIILCLVCCVCMLCVRVRVWVMIFFSPLCVYIIVCVCVCVHCSVCYNMCDCWGDCCVCSQCYSLAISKNHEGVCVCWCIPKVLVVKQ